GAPQRRMLIGGEWVEAKRGGTWDLVDPGSEEVVDRVALGGAEDVKAAVDAAQAAYPGWAGMTAYERAAVLEKAADWLTRNADDGKDYDWATRNAGHLPLLTSQESGKQLAEAKVVWVSAASYLRWFSGEDIRAYGRVVPPSAPKRLILFAPQPLGLVGTITAW